MASGSVFLTVATFFIVLIGVGAVVSWGLLTTDPTNRNNVITVSGTGEAFAVPDVATFSFTARAEAGTVKEAQSKVSEQVSLILAALETIGIDDKDIRTTSYNSYPRYEWRQQKLICNEFGCPPSSGERELVGYEQSQSVQVKVRDLGLVGDVLESLGEQNVDSLNGPNFAVDDEDAVLTEARKDAIAQAEQKARELTEELGVKLGKVVSFSDNSGSGGYYPVAMRSMAVAEMGFTEDVTFSPEIPAGENLVTASVSITYKIK